LDSSPGESRFVLHGFEFNIVYDAINQYFRERKPFFIVEFYLEKQRDRNEKERDTREKNRALRMSRLFHLSAEESLVSRKYVRELAIADSHNPRRASSANGIDS